MVWNNGMEYCTEYGVLAIYLRERVNSRYVWGWSSLDNNYQWSQQVCVCMHEDVLDIILKLSWYLGRWLVT